MAASPGAVAAGAPRPPSRATSVAPSCPHVTNYRGLMRVYHERLRVPFSWWLLGLATMLLLATEVVAGFAWPVAVAVYVVLAGLVAAMLWSWSRPTVLVSEGELRAGPACLPLAAVGEVTALDEAQTRSLRGPRGDPAAFLLIRPYLRRAVYVEVARPGGSEEHTSELQSQSKLVCRLLLEKKKKVTETCSPADA